jgi:hypothetical protein
LVVETQLPSKILTALTLAPLLPLLATWVLTEGFSKSPTLPPFFSKILPLILTLLSAVLAFFAYNAAKDEEPEWGESLVFKLVEGLALGFILLSIIFAAMVAVTYFAGL